MPWSMDQYSQDNKSKPRDDRIHNPFFARGKGRAWLQIFE
jgi:hypothetical protein